MGLGYKCFRCGIQVNTRKPQRWIDEDGVEQVTKRDCVSYEDGRYFCLKCRDIMNKEKKDEKKAKAQRDQEHWESIGELFPEEAK